MKPKTFIRESLNGHQVGLTIGVQTFHLEEQEAELGWTSLQRAEWYEKMLIIALENLEK